MVTSVVKLLPRVTQRSATDVSAVEMSLSQCVLALLLIIRKAHPTTSVVDTELVVPPFFSWSGADAEDHSGATQRTLRNVVDAYTTSLSHHTAAIDASARAASAPAPPAFSCPAASCVLHSPKHRSAAAVASRRWGARGGQRCQVA